MAQLKNTTVNGALDVTGNVTLANNLYNDLGYSILGINENTLTLGDSNLNLFLTSSSSFIDSDKPFLTQVMRITATEATAVTLSSGYQRVPCATITFSNVKDERATLSTDGGIQFNVDGKVLIFGTISASEQTAASRMSGSVFFYENGSSSGTILSAAGAYANAGTQSVHVPTIAWNVAAGDVVRLAAANSSSSGTTLTSGLTSLTIVFIE